MAFIRALFIFHLFTAILWFWSWVCLTFSSPWVTEILHSMSLYPQPPAACLNQKHRQPRRRQTQGETKCGCCGIETRREREEIEREREREEIDRKKERERVGGGSGENRSNGREAIKVLSPHSWRGRSMRQTWPIIFKFRQISLRFGCALHSVTELSDESSGEKKVFWDNSLTVLDVVELLIAERWVKRNQEKELCVPNWNNSTTPIAI